MGGDNTGGGSRGHSQPAHQIAHLAPAQEHITGDQPGEWPRAPPDPTLPERPACFPSGQSGAMMEILGPP